MAPTKRKATYDRSDSFVADDDSVDGEATLNPPKKRTKPSATTTTASVSDIPEMKTDEDGNQYWEISKARRVIISDYKGKKLVSVREYYQKEDKWLPGKKVSTLNPSVNPLFSDLARPTRQNRTDIHFVPGYLDDLGAILSVRQRDASDRGDVGEVRREGGTTKV